MPSLPTDAWDILTAFDLAKRYHENAQAELAKVASQKEADVKDAWAEVEKAEARAIALLKITGPLTTGSATFYLDPQYPSTIFSVSCKNAFDAKVTPEQIAAIVGPAIPSPPVIAVDDPDDVIDPSWGPAEPAPAIEPERPAAETTRAVDPPIGFGGSPRVDQI